MKSRITAPALAICASLFLVVSIAPSVAATPFAPGEKRPNATSDFKTPKAIWKMTLIQSKPVIKSISNPEGGAGTLQVFGAKLTDTSGKTVGTLAGSILSVELLAAEGEEAVRQRSLTFILPGGHLIAAGASLYPFSAQQIEVNRPVRIAIVGGTGKYLGASGQLTTVRLSDDTYKQTIELVRL